jgi:hypothetical protein
VRTWNLSVYISSGICFCMFHTGNSSNDWN